MKKTLLETEELKKIANIVKLKYPDGWIQLSTDKKVKK
jgi:hypothetical protein